MEIQLIKATTSDAEAMRIMQIESFTPHFQHYMDVETSPVNESLEKMIYRISYEKGCYLKIMVDSILAGCVWVHELTPKLYRIGIIYISPEFQCKGVGQKALAIVESLFPEAESWELDCPSDMAINRKCYEKVGYRFTGETRIINDKLTLVSYRKGI
ncbi:GNAT family N-acetyltransferase [Desulfosporosinus sp. I2]|uniref:GNAT family N-acetyltransferase n=1 Tax=Desulfosporosinus sp. I2 TaxID=1617025 RepID=UPI0005EE4777|nr:GNAT family N-acetyltransferase [Desulfosporosinus sp. I2]